MMSSTIDGKVLDWGWKKRTIDTLFMLEIFL